MNPSEDHRPAGAIAADLIALGRDHYARRRFPDAHAAFDQALALTPENVTALKYKGFIYADECRFKDAIEIFERALKSEPDDVEALSNIAVNWGKLGRFDEARAYLERAEELLPSAAQLKLTRAHFVNYDPASSAADVLHAAQSIWRPPSKLHAWRFRTHTPVPAQEDKKLRLGFISPDFRDHPVARLFLPALRALDRGQFDITLYSDRQSEDDITRAIKQNCTTWHVTKGLSDDQVLDLIERDDIDILFDMTALTLGNRLNVFMNKPAPVQVTWLGQSGTTGLGAIDHILVDRHVVLPGEEHYYSETPLVMPDTLLCYEPSADVSPVCDPPSAVSGRIAFGSFNNPAKINQDVVRLWAEILRAVPTASLTVKYHTLTNASAADIVAQQFESHGIERSRLSILGNTTTQDHLAAYDGIDIAFDPFPYSGTMTTLDALWKGVPVICIDGDRWQSRTTAGILKTVGLPQLVARDAADYVEKAIALSENPHQLRALRHGMRDRMRASPLMDAHGFGRALGTNLRRIWQEWCRRGD